MCWIFVKRTYLRVCWKSTIDLCLMNLPKRSSFKSVLKVYTLSKILLWIKPSYFTLENACYSWCMHQTGLFSSTSVVPQSTFTGELWSSASTKLKRYIFICKFWGFSKRFLPNCLVYLAQVFRDNWNCYALSIFRNFILLASSDNKKPMLMRQKCKQGFACIKMNLRFTKKAS